MKFEIKSWIDASVLFTIEIENGSLRMALEAAVKSRANLSRANLSGADLSGADLYGANLYGADLSRANLYGANLYGANLYGANLYGADLSGADLSGANLYGANLYGADLSGADLYGANLYGANLSGADLYGYFSFGPGGSRNAYTWSRWEEKGYIVHCGCFLDTIEKFEKAVKETHRKSFYAKYYLSNIETMKLIAAESKEAFEDAKKKMVKKETK
jgi:uncharacterized protein YjbI with pentapeptide repeats